MTGLDRSVLAATIIVSMALGLAFLAGFGRPWLAERGLRTMAWLQLALVAMPIGLDALLLLVVLRIAPPLWLVLLVLIGQDAVYGWRLTVLLLAHRERNRS